MKSLRTSAYKDKKKIGEGLCLAYVVPAGPIAGEFVAISFGNFNLHINKEDFEDFAREILGFPLYNRDKELENVSILRQNK